MSNHPNRSTAARLLVAGLEAARAIYHSGSVTLILDDERHNGGVAARLDAAALVLERARAAYNVDDNRQDTPLYREVESFLDNLFAGRMSVRARMGVN